MWHRKWNGKFKKKLNNTAKTLHSNIKIIFYSILQHKVCCPAPTRATVPPTRVTQPTSATSQTPRLTDYSFHRNAYLLDLDRCGNDNSNKIANGNKTEPFEFPWMAIIQYRNRKIILNS